MILQSLVIYLPSLVAGFVLMELCWRNHGLSTLGLKASLGIGAGLGITSCLYFLRLLAFRGQAGYLLIEVILLVIVLTLLFLQRRDDLRLSLPLVQFNRTGLLFGAAAVLVAAIAFYYLVMMARIMPHGDYDAQAIWNLRARSIFRLGDAWESAFTTLINRNFHMDYPLLIPLSVVGGWNTLGSEVLRVSSVLAILFFFSMAGTLYFSISYLRSSAHGAMAVLVLLATPTLLMFSTFQTADIPLTYFLIASVSLFVLAEKEDNRGLLFMAGMMAGLSAWTKNEGLPFVMLLLLCTLLVFGIQQTKSRLPILLSGMAFPLLTIILFKTRISVSNDLFTNNGVSDVIAKLITPTRYVQIGSHLISELGRVGGWPWSIILILLIYGGIMGRIQSRSVAEKALWILPGLQFATYMLIYLITPHELQWHMNYSMDRLLMHIFPMALFAFFMFIRPPESVFNKVQ